MLKTIFTWESQASCDTAHGGRYEMVQVSVCWGGKFKGSEADIVKGFIVNTVGFICVFNKLMDGQCGIVWFNNCV